MSIKNLPPGTVIELCRYLDIEGDGRRNWKQLVARIPGRVYSVYHIDAFARAGQRSHTSPAEEVIKDLISLGVTVDSLYRILHTMDARQCMETLKKHVSQEVIDEIETLRQGDLERTLYHQEPQIGFDPGDPLLHSDIHPVYGPLPNPPPPSSSSQTHQYTGPGQNHHSSHPPSSQSRLRQDQPYHTQSNGSSHVTQTGGGYHDAKTAKSQRAFQSESHQSTYSRTYSGRTSASVSGANQTSSSVFSSSEGVVSAAQSSPLFIPFHSHSPYQNGNGTTTGATGYNSHRQAPPVTNSVSTSTNYQPQSKGFPHPTYGRPGAPNDYRTAPGASSSQFTQYRAVANGSTSQQPASVSSPSWPSTYGGSSSQEHTGYDTPSGVLPPKLPQPHMTTPSYSNGSRPSFSDRSLDHGHYPSDSSSTTDSRSKVEDQNVAPNILKFRYAELSEATDGFVKGMVGLGSFGTVFRAKVRGNGPYAVKKLYTEREMVGGVFYEPLYQETFTQELNMLTKYHHRNILCLVAYSNDGPTPCLVYEYMENGSLADCLQGKRNISLLWNLRLTIANQIADALHFLHTVNKPKSVLVHGDVKSANILLDAQCVPKLSDFGLARECSTSVNQSTTINTKSDIVMGTMAYLAPEFIRNKKFKPSADVYSFGVVLLELFTGQLALSDDPAHQERVLTTRLATLIDDGSENHQAEVIAMADPKAFWPPQTGIEMFDIATVCLIHKPKQRPPMEQVLDQLHMISPQLSPSPQALGSPQTFGQNYEPPYNGFRH